MREAGSAMDFDLGLAVEQSNQNPVYYCQYAHARICSILKKLKSEGIEWRKPESAELQLLTSDEETDLIAHLAALTGTIVSAANTYDPAKITHYATDLATKFHRFYNAQRVMVEDEALMQARIFLCICVRDTMKNVLSMLKIQAPESM
jgi:arginyl-tRNA synthetase